MTCHGINATVCCNKWRERDREREKSARLSFDRSLVWFRDNSFRCVNWHYDIVQMCRTVDRRSEAGTFQHRKKEPATSQPHTFTQNRKWLRSVCALCTVQERGTQRVTVAQAMRCMRKCIYMHLCAQCLRRNYIINASEETRQLTST